MAEQNLSQIIHSITISVFACDQGESIGNFFFLICGGEFFSDNAQPRSKWIVRKFIEAFGSFIVARQMTRCAFVKIGGKKFIEMFCQRGAIGRSCGNCTRQQKSAAQKNNSKTKS